MRSLRCAKSSVAKRRCLAAAWFAGLGLFVASPTHAAPARPESYIAHVRPLLENYCFKCHGPEKQKGHVNFSLAGDDSQALRQRKLWRKSADELAANDMPPDDEPKQPTAAERELLLAWMKAATAYVDPDPAHQDPGPSLIRRLSLAEYDNTVKDLLGVQFDAATLVGMTDDNGVGDTYGNLAAALEIPPAQLDKYFAAAEKVLDRFFDTELSSSFDGAQRERATATRTALFGFSPRSWLRGNEPPKLPDGVNERALAQRIITDVLSRAYRTPAQPDDVEAMMKLYDHAIARADNQIKGVRLMLKAVLVSPRFLFRIERDASDAGAIAAHRTGDSELATRLSYFLWSSMPDAQLQEIADKGLLSSDRPSDAPTQLAGTILGSPEGRNKENLTTMAFDGDPFTFYEGPDADGDWVGLDLGTPRKLTQLRYAGAYYNPGSLHGGAFQGSSRADFGDAIELFKVDKPPQVGEIVRRDVNVPERYRYVRFVSAPGQNCRLAHFEAWGVSDGTVLEQQVRRMLASPRARALTDNFAARWLQLNKLASARPSTEFFPDFQPPIRAAMYEETAEFFDHLRSNDGSLLDLLDANYSYLNEDLAKYYGIPDVTGPQMRRVALKPEYHRGGLLGMGSMLALTSHTYRTSPTLRGKYLLDVVFGMPPPPPPANAGMFKDESKVKQAKSFREVLANHASDAACASCHKKLDPLGFAMENYNAAGIWRDADHGQPLDNRGVLPTGEKIAGVGELKQLILSRKAEFIRNVTQQFLIYGLGRDLDDYDDQTVQKIADDVSASGGKFSTLVMGIVKSYPFQYRRSLQAGTSN